MHRMLFVLPAVLTAGAATLTLTPAGVDAGFTLSTFATINPGLNSNTGIYGISVASGGNVLVSNFLNDTRYVFHDVDGQTTATAINSITPSGSGAGAYASAGGKAYGNVNTQFVQFNSDGTINHVLTGVTASAYFGMWGNPVNGHILATTGQGNIIDIDPTANGGNGSFRVVTHTGLIFDGVSISPDGTIVYVEENQSRVIGYNIASGAEVFNSGTLQSGPDGVGVIASNNALNGDLIVNFNGPFLNGLSTGFVGLLDPTTKNLTVIANNGTRGDYAAPDPSNGSLFLDYSDVVYRLSCGPNCAIGQAPPSPPVSGVPEPGTLFVAGPILLGIALLRAGRVHRRDSEIS